MSWKYNLFGNSLLYKSILTSLLIGILNGIFTSVIAMLSARALIKYKFIGQNSIKLLFSIPLFIPSIALFIGIHSMMIKLNIINTYLGVIIAHMLVSIPYSINIFIAFFSGINEDMENAAISLGSSTYKLYTRIIFPLISPGIYLSFSISFLISFSEYFSTFLVGGGNIITLPLLFYPYVSNGDSQNGAVIGIIFIIINLLIFIFAEYLSRKKIKTENYLFE